MSATAANVNPGTLHARAVLDLAKDVMVAEERIKRAILDAAEAGDCARVSTIITHWLTVPTTEVLADIPPKGTLIDASGPR